MDNLKSYNHAFVSFVSIGTQADEHPIFVGFDVVADGCLFILDYEDNYNILPHQAINYFFWLYFYHSKQKNITLLTWYINTGFESTDPSIICSKVIPIGPVQPFMRQFCITATTKSKYCLPPGCVSVW